MKNLAIIIVLFISVNGTLKAQNNESSGFNCLKINLISPLANSLNFSFEKSVIDRATIEVGIGFFSTEKAFETWPAFNSGGISFSSGHLYSVHKKSLIFQWNQYLGEKNSYSGLHVGPYLKLSNMVGSSVIHDEYGIPNYDSHHWMGIGFGANIGYSYVFKNKLSISAFAGIGYDTGNSFFPRGLTVNEYLSNETWKLVGFNMGKGLDARIGLVLGLGW